MRKRIFFLLAGLLLVISACPGFTGSEQYILFEDWGDGSSSSWPSGWSAADTNGDAACWELWDFAGYRGGQCIRYLSHSVNPADDWFFTGEILLQNGTQYTLACKSRVTSSSKSHKMSAWVGTAPDAASMTSLVFSRQDIANTGIEVISETFTVGNTGSYYIGFHCYSPADHLALFVDDVTVYCEQSALEVYLQMDKLFYEESNTYTPDEDMKCLLCIKNTGTSPVTVNSALLLGHDNDPDAVVSFMIINPGNELVPFRALYEVTEPGPDDFKELEPGGSVYGYINLNNGIFDFSLAGTYSIRTVYRNLYRLNGLPVWLGILVSDPVYIIVQEEV